MQGMGKQLLDELGGESEAFHLHQGIEDHAGDGDVMGTF